MGGMLQPSVQRETTTLADGCPIPPTLSLEHLRIKISQTPVRSPLRFILLFSIFLAYTTIAPVVSRVPSSQLLASQPNRSNEQGSNAPHPSYLTSSVRAGNQLASDSITVGNSPAPHTSIQNADAVPTYKNPWGM